MKTKFFSSVVALALVFSACNKDFIDETEVNGLKDEVGLKAGAVSQVVWKGESDKAVAVNITEKQSDRKNASGSKITSNAHSADFPGIYFIWDSKQKDNGYLKVAADVFDLYEGFTLTSKESNTFWDFNIQVQPGQQKTDDNCYVFFIPKVYNNKNINMVFIGGYLNKETPVIPEPPIVEKEDCLTTYLMLSGANDKSVVVDPNNVWTNLGAPIRTLWTNAISGAYPIDWAAMMSIQTQAGTTAQWIWNRMDSWEYGFTGSNLINTVSDFHIQGEILENEVPFYFACDNAAVVFVNGERVAYTTVAFEGGRGPVPDNSAIGFTDFSDAAFNGDVWQHLYKVDIKGFLKQGANRIVIVAANSDENNGRWNIDNNPAGLIYACKFTVGFNCDETPDSKVETRNIEAFEHMSGGQYGYVGMSYTNSSAPLEYLELAGNGYNYQITSRKAWEGLNNDEGVKIPVIGTINPVFNVRGGTTATTALPRAGYYVVEAYDKTTGELAIVFNITITPTVQDQLKLQ
jgi:hypothetical protein